MAAAGTHRKKRKTRAQPVSFVFLFKKRDTGVQQRFAVREQKGDKKIEITKKTTKKAEEIENISKTTKKNWPTPDR